MRALQPSASSGTDLRLSADFVLRLPPGYGSRCSPMVSTTRSNAGVSPFAVALTFVSGAPRTLCQRRRLGTATAPSADGSCEDLRHPQPLHRHPRHHSLSNQTRVRKSWYALCVESSKPVVTVSASMCAKHYSRDRQYCEQVQLEHGPYRALIARQQSAVAGGAIRECSPLPTDEVSLRSSST
jgi:hypothetical protein